jgi:short-subunit dehydrogenase
MFILSNLRGMNSSKKALVTGASEGIGREFALQLAKQGYTITAVARNQDRLHSLITELNSIQNGKHAFLRLDLSDLMQTQVITSHLRKVKYDLVVNNAGYGTYGKFFEVPLEKFQNMMRLNCDSLVAISHAFLKNAKAGDALINVASVLGLVPMPSQGIYSATKAFVVSFSESLWFEQKKRDVYVFALCPGSTETHFHDRSGGTKEQAPPKSVSQTAEQVVHAALKALQKRSCPIVVSGTQNRFFAFMLRLLPRKFILNIMGNAR